MWHFPTACIPSLSSYILHTCTITTKIVVFVYNHNHLYEDVMPAFPNSTYFFLFHTCNIRHAIFTHFLYPYRSGALSCTICFLSYWRFLAFTVLKTTYNS